MANSERTTTLYVMNRTYIMPNTAVLVVPDIATHAIVLSLALISNACLLTLESKIWIQRRRLSQPRLLIMSLAVIDALGSVLGILPRLVFADSLSRLIPSHTQMFLMSRYVFSCFVNMSKFTVVLMAIERFISIRAPFFYVRNCTIKCFCVVEAMFVIYSLLLGSLSVFLDWHLFKTTVPLLTDIDSLPANTVFLIFEFGITPQKMRLEWEFLSLTNVFTVFLVLQDFALVVILFICNSSVMLGLRGMEKRLMESCPRPTDGRANTADFLTASGKEFARLMVAINIVVVILMTPQMVRKLCNYFDTNHSAMADFVCQRLALSSAFVNPFLYGLLRRKLRRNFRLFLSRCCTLCRPNDVTPIELTRATDSQMRLPK